MKKLLKGLLISITEVLFFIGLDGFLSSEHDQYLKDSDNYSQQLYDADKNDDIDLPNYDSGSEVIANENKSDELEDEDHLEKANYYHRFFGKWGKHHGSILINKYADGEITDTLPGVIFQLSRIEDGNEIVKEIQTTDQNGRAMFDHLEYGRYLLKELKAPQGYIRDADHKINIKHLKRKIVLYINNDKEII